MDSRCPPHWTFAARAAYFGDRMCPFCDHRNPGDARFCNACASPLHLKPCKQCDAVNDEAATNCYKCGAACPVSFSTPEAMPKSPVAESTLASATPDNGAVAESATQPLFTSALPASRLRSRQFALAAIATIVIAAAYGVYRINEATPDAPGDASQRVIAAENNETTATPAAPPAVESKPAEPS